MESYAIQLEHSLIELESSAIQLERSLINWVYVNLERRFIIIFNYLRYLQI